jgi:hypothetical protein
VTLILFSLLLSILLVVFRDWARIPTPSQRSDAHELPPHLFRHPLPSLLKPLDVLLQIPNANSLQLPRQHLPLLVSVSDPLQLNVILHEEREILKRNVVLRPPAHLSLLLGRILTARKGVLVDLVFDLVGRVGEEDGGRVDRGGHLGTGALQRGEEYGVDERGFLVFHLLGVFAALAEIRVLVYRTRDQTRYRPRLERVVAEDVGEACRETGRGLGGTEVEFAYVVAVGEAEGGADGVDGDSFGHAADVFVEGARDVVEVGEDEGLGRVEADANDVFGVFGGVAFRVRDFEFRGVHVFFVIGEHYDEGNVEDVLEPSAKRSGLNQAEGVICISAPTW